MASPERVPAEEIMGGTMKKMKLKMLIGIVGAFMFLTGVKDIIPEMTPTAYILVGFLLFLVGMS